MLDIPNLIDAPPYQLYLTFEYNKKYYNKILNEIW